MANIMHNPSVDAWKVFRILAEFVDGFETMTDLGPSVSIFGSARVGKEHPHYKMGVKVAQKIAEKGFAVITGGGPGIMEAANRGAQKGKGVSAAVSVNLPFEEAANNFIDKKYHVKCRYFFVRKVLFVRYAQAFVFLPGGFGTLDELFEALTLIQTQRIRAFPIFLMGVKHWEGLLTWLKSSPLKEKYLSKKDFDLFYLTDDPDEVAEKIAEHVRLAGTAPTFELGK